MEKKNLQSEPSLITDDIQSLKELIVKKRRTKIIPFTSGRRKNKGKSFEKGKKQMHSKK